jgi:hypothetical protein
VASCCIIFLSENIAIQVVVENNLHLKDKSAQASLLDWQICEEDNLETSSLSPEIYGLCEEDFTTLLERRKIFGENKL